MMRSLGYKSFGVLIGNLLIRVVTYNNPLWVHKFSRQCAIRPTTEAMDGSRRYIHRVTFALLPFFASVQLKFFILLSGVLEFF
jgi:hypothetical protein